ncbi:MAG: hypothetical protein P4L33_02850 [Capsulimonadaceae bacterium]|nr:hypothetical protein [Capsulimonadaceae bacterium]
MIAERPTKLRAAPAETAESAAIRNSAGRLSIPAGAKLRYAEPQHDEVRTTSRRTKADRPALSSATATRPRAGRMAQANRWSQGETMLISALLAGAACVCVLGVIYLAAYMRVAYQGRVITGLQVERTIEVARQHALINEIGQLESPARIAQAAEKMGMVMGEKADYVTVQSSPARQPAETNSDTVAQVPTDSGPGSPGEN